MEQDRIVDITHLQILRARALRRRSQELRLRLERAHVQHRKVKVAFLTTRAVVRGVPKTFARQAFAVILGSIW